jgi:hypothetical protein
MREEGANLERVIWFISIFVHRFVSMLNLKSAFENPAIETFFCCEIGAPQTTIISLCMRTILWL